MIGVPNEIRMAATLGQAQHLRVELLRSREVENSRAGESDGDPSSAILHIYIGYGGSEAVAHDCQDNDVAMWKGPPDPARIGCVRLVM